MDHRAPLPSVRGSRDDGRIGQGALLRLLQGQAFRHDRGTFRYVLPAPDLAPQETILVPYRRFRGMMFTRDDTGLRDQVLDSTALGTRTTPLPRSLGIRPQALPAPIPSSRLAGGMLSADIPLQEALKNVYKSFPEARIPLEGDQPAGTEHERLVAMIGESVSMIYSPVYISKGNLCDAVLKEPVAPAPAGILDNVLPHGDGEKWKASFLPALCPDCGWDLKGDRRSPVQVCMKCSGRLERSRRRIPAHRMWYCSP
ncbi:MAG: hypothetical protein MZV70_28480 [Desulfobacterales bacterium]|nr:hypothetical protein [Desulfobacterales bacterium]